MRVSSFYDNNTATFTYVVEDVKTKQCAVIDSVLDYDQFSATVKTESADKVIQHIKDNDLTCQWILETHVHADHVTAAHYLQQKVGGQIAMGSRIKEVLKYWVPIFSTEEDTPINGEQYDVLFEDGDTFQIGELEVTVWHTPGHTPACASYLVGDAIFVGDTMFAPNLGSARCDFPGGSAEQLYQTIQRFYTLPNETKAYLGHDYPGPDALPTSMVTIGEAKTTNKQIKHTTTLEEYVEQRNKRDATLAVPKLLLPAIQANLRNGQFGKQSTNGTQFIKIPVNLFK